MRHIDRTRDEALALITAKFQPSHKPDRYACPVCDCDDAISFRVDGDVWLANADCGCPAVDVLRVAGVRPGDRGFRPEKATVIAHPALGDDWPDPIDFDISVPGFPFDVLPGIWQDMALAIADSSQTPVDLAATMLLAVASGCIAGKANAWLGRDHYEPGNLFILSPMTPGNRKTFVFNAITGPVKMFERELVSAAAIRLAEKAAMRDLKKSDLKVLKEKAAKIGPTVTAVSPQEAADRAALEEEIKRLARELTEGSDDDEAPTLIMDDTTPEQLITKMARNQGRMMILSDEGEIFEIAAGRYGKGENPNLGVFLKGHACSYLRVDRRGRTEILERPTLTMGVSPQPDILRGMLAKPGFNGRGFLARFLYCLPVSLIGIRPVDTPTIPGDVAEHYRIAIRRLLNMRGQLSENPDTGDVNESPRTYQADHDARRLLDDLKQRIEPDLADTGRLGHIQGWGAKLAGAAGRLALILELMRYADPVAFPAEDETPNEYMPPHAAYIDGKRMEGAIRLADYFTEHALAAYNEMGVGDELDLARDALNIIEAWGREQFTSQEIWQRLKGRKGFKKAQVVKDALAVLVERGWLRAHEEESQGPRPKGPSYTVSPKLVERKHEREAAKAAALKAAHDRLPRPHLPVDLSDTGGD